MPNLLQKFIYNFSAGAPLFLVLAYVWWTEKMTKTVPIICVLSFSVLVISFVISFKYCKGNLPPTYTRVNDIAPHDAWIVVYLISYVMPFASLALVDLDIILSSIIAIGIIVIAPFINSAIPHPLLYFRGYHFYQVSVKHGISGIVLISKRKLRNAKEIKYTCRIFEFLLLDEEGK